jgi:hypothetical protein
MPHARCRNCGCFREPVTEPDLFATPSGLPFPAADDPFLSFHRASQRREAEARRRGVCRAVGAERSARRDFTHQALRIAR